MGSRYKEPTPTKLETMKSNEKWITSIIVIVFILIGGALLGSQTNKSKKRIEARATTEYGRTVILYNDGTWKYWELQKKQSPPQKATPPNHKY